MFRRTGCPLTSKGLTHTKELIKGWKRSEILIINTIRESDLFVLEYRSEESQSKWSSVVVATEVPQDTVRKVLIESTGTGVDFKKGLENDGFY